MVNYFSLIWSNIYLTSHILESSFADIAAKALFVSPRIETASGFSLKTLSDELNISPIIVVTFYLYLQHQNNLVA